MGDGEGDTAGLGEGDAGSGLGEEGAGLGDGSGLGDRAGLGEEGSGLGDGSGLGEGAGGAGARHRSLLSAASPLQVKPAVQQTPGSGFSSQSFLTRQSADTPPQVPNGATTELQSLGAPGGRE